MDKNQIIDDYFNWLYYTVCEGRINHYVSYKKLFCFLYDTDFDFYIENDASRAQDGADLRYRFAIHLIEKYNLDDHYENEIIDILDKPCSVLEMMVALAIRCEETIMNDTRYGDRTGQWFWYMLQSLGLNHMSDDRFNEKLANRIITKFIERDYMPNGKGGLFIIDNPPEDLRTVEIWTQLCWFLNKFN